MLTRKVWAIKGRDEDGTEHFHAGGEHGEQFLLFLTEDCAKKYIAHQESTGKDYSSDFIKQVIMTLDDVKEDAEVEVATPEEWDAFKATATITIGDKTFTMKEIEEKTKTAKEAANG